jgi:hypothetical protein
MVIAGGATSFEPTCFTPCKSMSVRSGFSGMGWGLPDTMNVLGAWRRCVSSKTVSMICGFFLVSASTA